MGFALGRRFAARIHAGLEGYAFFQERLRPYHRTSEGQARYRELLALNRARFPAYVAKLEGLAQGAGRPFDELFLVNMRGEYREHLHGAERGCSDCAVVTDKAALIGHNEDGAPGFRGNLYLVRAHVTGQPAFTALTYPGFLPGNAFGFNAEGVCFTIRSSLSYSCLFYLGPYSLVSSPVPSTPRRKSFGSLSLRAKALLPERSNLHLPERNRLFSAKGDCASRRREAVAPLLAMTTNEGLGPRCSRLWSNRA